MSEKTETLCCANCVHAKRVFFVWFCACPEVINGRIDPVTGRHDWLSLTCRKVRAWCKKSDWMICSFFEPRKFTIPPKETPMHKAPPREDKIDGCDSCTWHQPGAFDGRVMYHVCKHEKSKWEGWYNLQCIDMRTNEDLCGKEKKLYKPKETPK